MMSNWKNTNSFNTFPEHKSPPNYMQIDEDIEWLMQPRVYDNPQKKSWELSEMIADLLSTLDDADQEMIQLVYYERKSFQEAAKELGLNAKSYAWRKTKASVEKFAEALKQKPEIMELINEKYGLGEPDETDQTLS